MTLSRASNFENQARGFAKSLSDLLNRTITKGIRIKSVLRDDRELGWVGYKITKTDFAPGSLIPLKISKAPPAAFLHISMTLHLDPEIDRLVVQRSTCGLYAHDDDFQSMICHYDFDRDPENQYPDAHFQVGGSNDHLDVLCDRAKTSKSLRDLHFPVGGRRFRPSVEDTIEFLIVEGLASFHDGWEDAIAEHRDGWNEVQLRSVVRRQPEIAADALRGLGYDVESPRVS